MFAPHNSMHRRDWLRLSALGAAGASACSWLPSLAAHAAGVDGRRAKSCIVLWMDGGPSQVHTFSVPEAGDFQEYKAIDTAVPGIRISEHLPKIAAQMHDFALIRTMSTGLNNHDAAGYLMHVGYRQSLAIDYPSLGAVVSSENGAADADVPNFIAMGGIRSGRRPRLSGFLGPRHSPLVLGHGGVANVKAPVGPARNAARTALLDEVEQAAYERFRTPTVAAHRASYEQALRLMHSDKLSALDLDGEDKATVEAYGKHDFGEQCLLARRLIEAGVSFVEVSWGGWDDHGGAGKPMLKRSPLLDQTLTALVSDLKQRGLLDSTLVVWMGEFGRGPRPGLGGGNNHGIGAGHYARAWTTVLAGAGLKTGQVIGQTTPDCVDVADRPVSAGDFMATICQAIDIDPTKVIGEPGGRPHYVSPDGSRPIVELF